MIIGYETCLNLLLGWVILQLTIVVVITRDEGLKRVRPQFFVCFCCRCARVAPLAGSVIALWFVLLNPVQSTMGQKKRTLSDLTVGDRNALLVALDAFQGSLEDDE